MKLVQESLNEVGSATMASYYFEKRSENELQTLYHFQTEDKDDYVVRFFNLENIQKKRSFKDSYQVDFVTKGKDGDSNILNKGRFFRVIATVIDVIKDFIKEHPEFKSIKISPVQNFRNDKRRYNIYQRYIEKNIPDNYQLKKGFFGDLFIKNKS